MNNKEVGQGRQDQSNNHSKEQGGVYHNSNASTPLSPLKQGEQGRYERPHEELVKGFRDYIAYQQGRYLRVLGERVSPERTISNELYLYEALPVLIHAYGEDKEEKKKNDKQEMAFWTPISVAWDVLTYDRYEPGSSPEQDTGMSVSYRYNRSREPVIKLSDPQVRMLDALAEAVGMPHQKGQTEIEIPEKLRDYENWVMSEEYEELVA
jgi:hypothetical protein